MASRMNGRQRRESKRATKPADTATIVGGDIPTPTAVNMDGDIPIAITLNNVMTSGGDIPLIATESAMVNVARPAVPRDPSSPWNVDRIPDVPSNPHVGVFTGRSIMAFQNWLYVVNADPSMRLSDYRLAILWAVEFPSARCNFMAHPDYVGSTRTLYNRGKHAQTTAPAIASIPYTADGQPARYAVCRPANVDRTHAVLANRRDRDTV